jgi:hypothetical protein
MKAKISIFIVFFLAAGLLMGCGDRKTDQMLSSIDTLMNNHPDSALQILDSLKSEQPHWSKSQRMRYDLLHLKAENKADVLLNSDSIAKQLVNYYERWGSANEKILAYYLLGRCYSDMGDSPRAIDAYQKAVSQADTTAKDCDFHTLSRVYSQMAGVYYEQLLLAKSIEASNNASHYALLSRDTLNYIRELDLSAGAYILLNKQDSAEIILKDVYQQYLKNGYIQDALFSSTKRIYLYVKDPNKLLEAKQLIDEFEAESNLFDSNHELSGTKRIFYYYKGQYFEGINDLDSAEYYYRKIKYSQMPFTAQNSMYKGLLSVFAKKSIADSIAKYAQLYCEVNDSSIAKKDQELTAQMSATYDYGLYQKEAFESESKAHRAQLALAAMLLVVTFVGFFIYYRWQSNRRKHEDLKVEYANISEEYNRNIQTLQLLDETKTEAIETIQQENQQLKERIDSLKAQEGIREHLIKSNQFANTDIVKYINNVIVNNPVKNTMTESNWEQLTEAVNLYYPTLMRDLSQSSSISQQDIRVCLLVCLSLRVNDIAGLLNVSGQRITNIKASLNETLFGENSARSLYKNLALRYNIYSV